MITQYVPRPGILDLGWGHPRPGLLPVSEWAATYARSVDTSSLTYGSLSGPGPLVDWLRSRLDYSGYLYVSAGASQALELVSSLLIRPGDPVLVQSPTYHLALRTLRDHTTSLVPLPEDLDPSAVADVVRTSGARLLYYVPMYANPTGVSVPASQRRALAEVSSRTGVWIVEDCTYWELAYDEPVQPWLGDVGERVIRLGSFSKTVAPGLRLGWVTAGDEMARMIAGRGYLDSGGGVNHATAMAMAEFALGYDRHLERVRGEYRGQRDALAGALAGGPLSFSVPAGGWFLWCRLPDDSRSAELLRVAEDAGVSYLPGGLFRTADHTGTHLRLSFSMLTVDALTEAGYRLRTALSVT